jgi:hypothetical protein
MVSKCPGERIVLCFGSQLKPERARTLSWRVLGWLKQVVAMLGEIFIVRLEAARLQTALLRRSPFVPFTQSKPFVFKDSGARPANQPQEAGNEHVS